jgi:hypothetical protein
MLVVETAVNEINPTLSASLAQVVMGKRVRRRMVRRIVWHFFIDLISF